MPLSVDDRLEILDLMHRYNHCADGGDGEGFADTFAEGGLFEGSMRTARTREELVQAGSSGGGLWKHWLSSPIIEGDGDHATARVYLVRTGRAEDGSVELIASGTYHDTLARIDGEWKFTHRKVHPDQ